MQVTASSFGCMDREDGCLELDARLHWRAIIFVPGINQTGSALGYSSGTLSNILADHLEPKSREKTSIKFHRIPASLTKAYASPFARRAETAILKESTGEFSRSAL